MMVVMKMLVCVEHACLSVSLSARISQKLHSRTYVTYGTVSDLLWRLCDTLCRPTFGFADDIVFT